ncbi:MAG: hypothetical protein JST42_20920, partial [Bacteroidetes bacterium]|nr:hypothetical protein [Bacteroidota bacterium]
SLTLTTTLLAQTATDTTKTKTPPSPAMKAAHRLTTLTKQLHLNENQVENIRAILADATVSLDSLRNHPSGQRRRDAQARRSLTQDTDAKISALLTDDQRLKYQQMKEEQQQKRKERKGLPANPDPGTNP